MAEFLQGNSLNTEIESILRTAEQQLLLISPYIKLHDRFKDSLLKHRDNDKLEIMVVFGKNEDNVAKSMSVDDLTFFTQFRNIEVRYEKRLHAKYYANESAAVITSMNLYSYSNDNNIEAGVLFEASLFQSSALERDAIGYFREVRRLSEIIYKKVPQYESAMLGLQRKYTKSNIEIDKIHLFFQQPSYNRSSSTQTSSVIGYCIRTGVEIPFNLERPYSAAAYKSWSLYKNPNYKEKYCHKSGVLSEGKTSMSKPVLGDL